MYRLNEWYLRTTEKMKSSKKHNGIAPRAEIKHRAPVGPSPLENSIGPLGCFFDNGAYDIVNIVEYPVMPRFGKGVNLATGQ